jgi:hypothetical protein
MRATLADLIAGSLCLAIAKTFGEPAEPKSGDSIRSLNVAVFGRRAVQARTRGLLLHIPVGKRFQEGDNVFLLLIREADSHSTPGWIENSAPLAALMLCTVLDHT